MPSSIYYNPDDDSLNSKKTAAKSQSTSILMSKPPMSPLPVNRNYSLASSGGKSASRAASRGAVDDALLSSPMPQYPRRRSVTFLPGEERAAAAEPEVREERPCYHTATLESAAKPPMRPDVVEAVDQTTNIEKTAPTPRKRSLSRQRMAEKRQAAMLHHSFYDDSFVEEFVSSARTELQAERERKAKERDEAERQRDEARRLQKKTQSEAAVRLADAAATLRDANRNAPVQLAEEPKQRKVTISRAASEADSDDDNAVVVPASRATSTRSTNARGKKEAKRAAKKAKKQEQLNKLIQKVLAEQRRLRKSTRQSVIVVDLSDNDDDEISGADVDDASSEDERPPQKKQRKEPSRPAPNISVRPASVAPPPKPAVALSAKPAAAPPAAPLARLDSEDRPILLTRRPPPKKRSAARSVSLDPISLSTMQSEAPKPKRAQRAAAAKKAVEPDHTSFIAQPTPSRVKHTTARVAAAVARTMTASFVEPDIPVEQPKAAERRRTAAPQPPQFAVAPQQSRAGHAAKSTKAPPLDDPMAIFFEAAFPTPSKFEESMNRSAGMPMGSSRSRHQALTLPPSIRRK